MLQDVGAGKPPDLDRIVGAVAELADKLEVPVPQARAVYACAKLLEKISGRATPVGRASRRSR